ncbi:MAG: HD domain-containing protein [Kiritimatiellae bacterium]|nr:HD domain-containing protein [Kiritimatiellia bacterium]
MNHIQIPKLAKDSVVLGFLMVKSAEVKKTAAGKTYIDLVLMNKTGNISAKYWGEATPPASGDILDVNATVTEFNGKLQLKLEAIVFAPADIDKREFLPYSPRPAEEMLQEVLATIMEFQDKEIQQLTSELIGEAGETLKKFPAAKQMHHAEIGGLLHHITSMLKLAKGIAANYPELNRDLLLAGVIIHDLGKMQEMERNELGLVTDYTVQGKLVGHIVCGAMNIERAGKRIGVSDNTIMLLQHMVLSHHGEPEFGSAQRPLIPEAEVLSTIDRLDARMFEMFEALREVPAGSFSAKVWALDNRELYKAR